MDQNTTRKPRILHYQCKNYNVILLEKGAHQGHPVSACLFILCLEVSFLHVKVNHQTRDVNIFQYNYLYTAHADDTTFLKNKTSIRRLMETFSTFSQYCCLKPSYGKCEVAEIRVLISVKVAVCGMKCIYLCKDTVIITRVRFSYNKHKQDGENLWETKTKI